MLKCLPPLLAALVFQTASVSAAEQCVTLGDSLTFAYEAEFGFYVSIPLVGTYGDGFGPEVRNWAEILNDTAYRNASFDLGSRNGVTLLGFFPLFFRHQNNWALPGLKIAQLRSFMDGVSIDSLIAGDSLLAPLLLLSNFSGETDYRLGDLEFQIQNSAERLVFFIGGNDIDAVYGGIYDGDPPGTFVADFISDAAAILDRVLALNPNIQIVVVNVPHVGITPDVKSTYPTDPVKTARVTAVLRDLNQQLAGLASARGLGYADVFTPTLSLLGTAPLCIHGITFANDGSTTGNLDHVWLNGEYSANFHPNTNAQALVANEIIDAFNTRYHTGIPPLTATEMLGGQMIGGQMLGGLLGKSASAIDMPFATWMAGFGLTGLPANDDSDGDGIPASVEFALGLNPTLRDAHKVNSALVDNGGSPALDLAYPIRLPVSSRYSLAPAWTSDLTTPFAPFSVLPATGTDGLAHAMFPLAGGTGFLRLESRVGP
jgi:hypothetical protein